MSGDQGFLGPALVYVLISGVYLAYTLAGRAPRPAELKRRGRTRS